MKTLWQITFKLILTHRNLTIHLPPPLIRCSTKNPSADDWDRSTAFASRRLTIYPSAAIFLRWNTTSWRLCDDTMTLTQCRERKRILTSRVHCSIPKTGWYLDGVEKNTTHSSPVVSTCRFNSMCLKINSNSSTYCDHFIFVSGATYHVVFFICLGDTA